MLGALAVAIEGVDEFDEIEFIDECNKYNFMIPIAGFNPSKNELKKDYLQSQNLDIVG